MSSDKRRDHVRMARRILYEYTTERGWLGPLKLVCKAALLVLRRPTHRAWLRVIGGPTTKHGLVVHPRLAFRHSSQYLFFGLNRSRRIAMLSTHYAFLNRVHDAPFFTEVLGPDGVSLWHRTLEGRHLAIHLLGPESHREGDLVLSMRMDGVHLYRLAFSIVPSAHFGDDRAGTPHAIYVGQVQGASGQFEKIRQATRLAGAIAPQDLLMSALAGLANAWNIDRVLGVGIERHLSVANVAALPQAFDYAAFWHQYQAVRDDDGHYRIAVPFVQKPSGQIVTRHRKRVSIKREFKLALTSDVAAIVRARSTSCPVSAEREGTVIDGG